MSRYVNKYLGRSILWNFSIKFILMFILIYLPTEVASTPNYYYSAINYKEYQGLGELEQKEQAGKIEAYLQKQVPGLPVSYREVIDALVTAGHDVYLRGGVIRDLLSITNSEPSDVDLDYTGEVKDLITILEKNHWCYTQFPGRKLVVIGDHRHNSIDAMPVRQDEASTGDAALEFTINNIFYHCNTNSFLRGGEIGLQDLSYDRLNIIAKDWNVWLYENKSHHYYKLFRFWKMVGKGYVYSTIFQNFFYNEASKIISEDEDGFQKDVVQYLAGHLSSYDDVIHGVTAIMGYEWAQEHVVKLRSEILGLHGNIESQKDKYTFHP
jgi:hypothetical protein